MTVTMTNRAEELLQEALVSADPAKSKMTPAEAVTDIRELRKGITLGGLKIKDLIEEGRKY